MPWVWDHVNGRVGPVFDKNSHANRVLSLLMRHYNAVVEAFNTDPAGLEPMFMRGADYGATEWSDGFLCGFQFDERASSLLAVGQPTHFQATRLDGRPLPALWPYDPTLCKR